MNVITAVLLGAALVAPGKTKVVESHPGGPQPLTVTSTYRLDVTVAHYTQMLSGEPTYLPLIVNESPFETREAAVARAQQIVKDGLCWGDEVVTCYPSYRILRTLVQPITE